MHVTSFKGLFAPASFTMLFLPGCAASQTAQPMAGMGGGMKMAHEPHMMMQALGCDHAPMDMAAMKAMSPEQHKAMMAKHIADCREKLMSEGRVEANARTKDCLTRAIADASKGGKRIAVARVDAAVQSCTQSMANGPSPNPAAPEHQH
jgi:hypothetical protein